ncbi:unnamed protein product [Heligmosomoides polygyrus]|uniref:T6PP_N domain-containing protein n=1 Tax=Heligmosomoides polygyrus TaxID=6339 RepID=A0A183F7S4_HELPZ|nr:unnamed protein product [Heligmosomoides polygyrus]
MHRIPGTSLTSDILDPIWNEGSFNRQYFLVAYRILFFEVKSIPHALEHFHTICYHSRECMPHFFVFFNVRKNFFTRVLRLLYIVFQMQNVRRQIVEEVLHSCVVDEPQMRALDEALEELTDSRTVGEMRHISTPTADFPINIRDEIRGLRVSFTFFLSSRRLNSSATFYGFLLTRFYLTVRFLMGFVDSADSSIKPLLITDWDGTMKDYCSQYATNLQPVYSAVLLGRFAELFTRVTAVLTAGPLRGPGILDLTALPINGPVLFRCFLKALKKCTDVQPIFSRKSRDNFAVYGLTLSWRRAISRRFGRFYLKASASFWRCFV